MKEAVALLSEASHRADSDRYRFMVGLIEAHQYKDAAAVLNSGAGSVKEGSIDDGDFEHGRLSRDVGFAWQVPQQIGTTTIAVDQDYARSGSRSLRLIFNGESSSETEFVKQLVLSQPRARYRLFFAARSEALNSDGQVTVSVLDAGLDGRRLGISGPVTQGTADWRDYSVEFETDAQTQAFYVVIQPQKCESNTCSISGKAWFDTFSLRKL
jgi:hypothetical protein